MIESIGKGAFICICDSCGSEQLEGESFYDVKYDADEKGWLTKRYGDDWFNYCPNCAIGMEVLFNGTNS